MCHGTAFFSANKCWLNIGRWLASSSGLFEVISILLSYHQWCPDGVAKRPRPKVYYLLADEKGSADTPLPFSYFTARDSRLVQNWLTDKQPLPWQIEVTAALPMAVNKSPTNSVSGCTIWLPAPMRRAKKPVNVLQSTQFYGFIILTGVPTWAILYRLFAAEIGNSTQPLLCGKPYEARLKPCIAIFPMRPITHGTWGS